MYSHLMNRLGIETVSAFGLPPVEYVNLAADLGCASSAADLAVLDPDLIGYVQLCDAPLVSKFSSYMQEAMTERMVPGQGELPLLEILEAVPRDRIVSLELPLLSQAKAGIGPLERLRPAVAAAKALLGQI